MAMSSESSWLNRAFCVRLCLLTNHIFAMKSWSPWHRGSKDNAENGKGGVPIALV